MTVQGSQAQELSAGVTSALDIPPQFLEVISLPEPS